MGKDNGQPVKGETETWQDNHSFIFRIPGRGFRKSITAKTFRDGIEAVGGFRQAGKAYAVGDIVYASALASTQKLVCIKAGTTGSGSLALSSTAEGALTTDGSVVWQVDSLADGIYDAAHQNGAYRGADLTAYWDSGYMSTNIQAGKFVGMHIGDYITKTINLPAITYTDKSGASKTQDAQTFSNVKWLLGGIDAHFHSGDMGGTTEHHVLLITANTLQRNVVFNSTPTTEGGYLGSDMWQIHMPNWTSAVESAFGSDHVLTYKSYLSNVLDSTAVSSGGGQFVGATAHGVWTNVKVNIPNESMVFGGMVYGSSGIEGGEVPMQLPLFAHKQYAGGDDYSWYYLRTVVSSERVAIASYAGFSNCVVPDLSTSSAGARNSGGIRPYFLLR